MPAGTPRFPRFASKECKDWRDAALEVILWWHDQHEDGDGPPPAIRELERLLARYDGGIPDSDPQRQADWIDARLDEHCRK